MASCQKFPTTRALHALGAGDPGTHSHKDNGNIKNRKITSGLHLWSHPCWGGRGLRQRPKIYKNIHCLYTLITEIGGPMGVPLGDGSTALRCCMMQIPHHDSASPTREFFERGQRAFVRVKVVLISRVNTEQHCKRAVQSTCVAN